MSRPVAAGRCYGRGCYIGEASSSARKASWAGPGLRRRTLGQVRLGAPHQKRALEGLAGCRWVGPRPSSPRRPGHLRRATCTHLGPECA